MDKKLTLNLSLKGVLAFVVAFVLGFSLSWWSPWSDSERSVSVNGEATLSAAPDEFVFTPYYQKTAATRTEATTAVRTLGDQVVAKIKELGVEESMIKTDISAYDFSIKPEGQTTDEFQATYAVTVTLSDQELAQKVFDYLLTTESIGAVSPQTTFSDDTRARLKSEARKNAVNNARIQAEEIAGELNKKVGDALSVEEISGFDFDYPFAVDGRDMASSPGGTETTTQILPGEQDLTFNVKVVFVLN